MPITVTELHALLRRVVFPATPEEIAAALQRAGAPAAALARLRALPAHRYGSIDAVMDALRGLE